MKQLLVVCLAWPASSGSAMWPSSLQGVKSAAYKKALEAFDGDEDRLTAAWERVQELGYEFFPVVTSPTYVAGGPVEKLTREERAWFNAAMPLAYEATQAIFGLQLHPGYNETEGWFRMSSSTRNKHAMFHWSRARGDSFAINESKAAAELGIERATARALTRPLPWLPDPCTFSNMWPCDMTQEELTKITKEFPPDDPIQLAYTKVSRATAHDAARILSNPIRVGERVVEFYRPAAWAGGEVGYRVVNMAFDEQMRRYFVALASALRAPSTGLSELFRNYLTEAAQHLEAGDFEALLNADLKQDGRYGKLYFSVFPHEGYWDDNLKFPLTLAVGIRDESSIVPAGPEFTELLNSLAKRVETECKAIGLNSYQAPLLPVKPKEEDGSMVGLWALKTAGFKRAFMRDPGGHDYPKRDYPGVVDHRNVILFDTVATWSKLANFMGHHVFGEAVEIGFEGLLRFVFLHEASHGTQIRPNSATLKADDSGGRAALAEAFGAWWGVLVEPWADTGAILGCSDAAHRGLISDADWRQCALATIGLQLVRLRPRADILETPTAAPHLTGTSVFLSLLVESGALQCDLNRSPLCQVDVSVVDKVASSFFDKLSRIGASGEVSDLQKLVNASIEAMPKDLEERLLVIRGQAPSYNLLDRGGDLTGAMTQSVIAAHAEL